MWRSTVQEQSNKSALTSFIIFIIYSFQSEREPFHINLIEGLQAERVELKSTWQSDFNVDRRLRRHQQLVGS